jgi:hypothetical protein
MIDYDDDDDDDNNDDDDDNDDDDNDNVPAGCQHKRNKQSAEEPTVIIQILAQQINLTIMEYDFDRKLQRCVAKI